MTEDRGQTTEVPEVGIRNAAFDKLRRDKVGKESRQEDGKVRGSGSRKWDPSSSRKKGTMPRQECGR